MIYVQKHDTYFQQSTTNPIENSICFVFWSRLSFTVLSLCSENLVMINIDKRKKGKTSKTNKPCVQGAHGEMVKRARLLSDIPRPKIASPWLQNTLQLGYVFLCFIFCIFGFVCFDFSNHIQIDFSKTHKKTKGHIPSSSLILRPSPPKTKT